MASPRILYCRCAYAKVVPQAVKDGVLEGLSESETAFDAVADLCQMSAAKDPALQRLSKQSGLKIAACYPRAVKWLFAAANAPLQDDTQVVNMRTLSAEQSCQQLLGGACPSAEAPTDDAPQTLED